VNHSIIADVRAGEAQACQILHAAEVNQTIVRNLCFFQSKFRKLLQLPEHCQAGVCDCRFLKIEALQ
jgi:hypothetical protein